MGTRKRFQVKTNLLGSSEFSKLLSKKAILEEAHREFLESDLKDKIESMPSNSREPKDSDFVKVVILGKVELVQYSIVKKTGYKWNWL